MLAYISLCTDPTTGENSAASYAMLGDINVTREPGSVNRFCLPPRSCKRYNW
jgi:acetyl-CoA carboxylase beta subunit